MSQFSISISGENGGSSVKYRVSNDRTIHSAAVDISFDTRFEFNKFLWGPKGGRGVYVYFT